MTVKIKLELHQLVKLAKYCSNDSVVTIIILLRNKYQHGEVSPTHT